MANRLPIPDLAAFEAFLISTGRQNPVILLEGKRSIPGADSPKLVQLGKILAQRFTHLHFRSGNAKGADALFSSGVAAVSPERLQQVIPYRTHRKTVAIEGIYTIPLEDVNLVSEPDVIQYTADANKAAAGLIPQWLEGKTNRLTAKVPYLLRDTVKVLGSVSASLEPADFAIFYDDLAKPRSGGTGHTMKICEKHSVPYIDQTVWMKWFD
ncbi:MAG: hypothetical protein HRU80_03745 [Ignavibacteriales bacterium]|nr:hypothetical protein [Ignavibacteriaceae bacterium]QOJ28031.1 MAG: hypothetical protein HRU80_03745 [Ignavibacteriales bacterium]